MLVMQRLPSLFEHRTGLPGPAATDPEGRFAPTGKEVGPGRASAADGVAPAPRPSGRIARADRRLYPRVAVQLDVSLGADGHYFTAHAADLSGGGLFVGTYRALDVGSELSIEFD